MVVYVRQLSFRLRLDMMLSYVSCADISGVPGTGKTATVHAMVRELKRMAERNVSTSHLHLHSIFIWCRFVDKITIR